MTTEINKPTDDVSFKPTDNMPLGQALKDARLGASLSVEEVAEQLNLSVTTIKDIEDNFENVLQENKYPVIYLRGYLVNYAKLVGFKKLDSFVEYQQFTSVHKRPKTMASSGLIIPKGKKRSKKLPLFLLLIVVIVAVVYLFQSQLLSALGHAETLFQNNNEQTTINGSNQQDETINNDSTVLIAKGEFGSDENTDTESLPADEQSDVSDLELESPLENTDQQDAIVNDPSVIDSRTQELLSEPETEEQQTQAQLLNIEGDGAISEQNMAVQNSTSQNVIEPDATILNSAPLPTEEGLLLTFNDDCWTEVFDATGKRIAFGLYKSGKVLTLSGIAPFSLKLGNPSVVEIQYQDQIIEGEFTPGRSAQFSVPLS